MSSRESPIRNAGAKTAHRSGLRLAISPYHLATRELAATVALTLADHAVTIVPEPAEGHGRDAIRHAIDRVPRLLRVLESWRWSGPLWRIGLVAGEQDGVRPFGSIGEAAATIAADPSLARLSRGRDRPDVAGDEADRWLDSFCSDLLKGGPDPALSTIATAALDTFASSHGLVAVRGSTDSVAQRAETKMLRRSFSIAIPVMSRAAGGKILELRSALRSELDALRGALAEAWSGRSHSEDSAASRTQAVEAYANAFERWFARASRDDENAERTMRAFVGLTVANLPADSAFVCARAALGATTRAASAARSKGTPNVSSADRELRVLTVRPMNVRPV